MNWKCSFLTGTVGVRSKHKYKHPLADKPALNSHIHQFNFHAEGRPFWFHSRILRQHLLLRLYFFLPDTCNLLQAKNAQCSNEYSVYKINPDIHMLCEMPAAVNTYRAECNLSDADSHFFPNNSSCSLLNVCITNREQRARDVRISKGKWSTRYKQNFS